MAKKNIATFLGTGSGLTVLGSHCYALSGVHVLNNSTSTALLFTTGDYYVRAGFQIEGEYGLIGGDKQFTVETKFNNVSIMADSHKTDGNLGLDWNDLRLLIIPPRTTVEIIIGTNYTSDVDFYVSLTGRIYDV